MIGKKWRYVGEILELESYKLNEFEEAKKEHRDKCRMMLDSWASKCHKEAKRRRLIDAMKEEGLKAQAAEVFGEEYV